MISSESSQVGGPVDDILIQQVEEELGFAFYPDYSEFLKTFGYIAVHAAYLAGLDIPSFDPKKRILEDLRAQVSEYAQIYEAPILGARTFLENSDNEWYLLMDHVDGKVYSYDPIIKKYEEYKPNLEEAIVEFWSAGFRLLLMIRMKRCLPMKSKSLKAAARPD